MTIAEQVAQCFLESIEKTINENKMDVGALESNTYYRSEKAKMVVTDTKTGIVIATMTCDMNPKRRKQENQAKNEKEKNVIKRKNPYYKSLSKEKFMKRNALNRNRRGRK